MGKVRAMYDIDEDQMVRMGMREPYWKSASVFWYDVKNRDCADLSTPQHNWLCKIETNLKEIE
jgi:hypothetical protein